MTARAEPAGLDDALRERVRTHLERFEHISVPAEGRRRAAVAVTLVNAEPEAGEDDEGGEGADRPAFLITRRARGLRNHGGQWALPGGRLDPGETAADAARRELEEELGLACGPDAVLGLLDDFATRSGFVITPVVVFAGRVPKLVPDPGEVAAAHRVPLHVLDAPEVPQLRESDRPVISIPMLGTHIHAPTAAILFQLREVALRGHATRVAHFEQPVFAWR